MVRAAKYTVGQLQVLLQPRGMGWLSGSENVVITVKLFSVILSLLSFQVCPNSSSPTTQENKKLQVFKCKVQRQKA